MGLYLFQHPKTGKIVEVFQNMNDEHVYEENGVKFDRVFTKPNAGVDTQVDLFSSQDFAEKTGKKKGSVGDLWDQSKELSEKRKNKLGYDPIETKYFDEYSKKRRGLKHPNDPSKKGKIESKMFDVEL